MMTLDVFLNLKLPEEGFVVDLAPRVQRRVGTTGLENVFGYALAIDSNGLVDVLWDGVMGVERVSIGRLLFFSTNGTERES